jgi:hypothetical protein
VKYELMVLVGAFELTHVQGIMVLEKIKMEILIEKFLNDLILLLLKFLNMLEKVLKRLLLKEP